LEGSQAEYCTWNDTGMLYLQDRMWIEHKGVLSISE